MQITDFLFQYFFLYHLFCKSFSKQFFSNPAPFREPQNLNQFSKLQNHQHQQSIWGLQDAYFGKNSYNLARTSACGAFKVLASLES